MTENTPYRAKDVVKEDFDKLTNYDEKRDMYYFERRLQRLLQELPEAKTATILDFGGGSGLFSLELKKKGYSRLHLLDLSPVQCQQAKDKGLENIHCGDENYLLQKFPPQTFDFIFMCDVIEHVENPAETLRKLKTVLKPSGKIFLTYPNPYWVPMLNVLGEIGLKLKGKDNKIYLRKLAGEVQTELSFETHEGHMLVSKLPKSILALFERIEKMVPKTLKRKICLLNVAVASPKA